MVAVVALLGAGFALSVFGVIAGLRKQVVQPSGLRRPVLTREILTRAAIAVLIGAAVGLWTRWPVGALLAGIVAYALPAALGSNKHQKEALARTEAVAAWAEMLRDNLSAAAGLEQTILVTAPFAPPAIYDEVADLAAALRLGTRLPVALAELRERMDDPTGRLVVRALLQASQRQSRQLAELLSEMARRARERANLRLRIAPGHARIRTNARIIVTFTLAMAAGLTLFNRQFLAPYDDLIGQFVLIIVGLIFAAGFVGIARLSRVGVDTPRRPS
ncbi:type II secretion system F family protein [Micromonospora sp. Llam7]|uniref:type II secretion system F family protein n=1 Tax=Micromonospora tarapacensis TaxID=2835305 RepID=UPI001C83BF16|nr:type II secretion system F family protein [Micromonospora tarapacensis]MBX7267596.1 type II secretion system F family protein [Micromonospora tarapacensis]